MDMVQRSNPYQKIDEYIAHPARTRKKHSSKPLTTAQRHRKRSSTRVYTDVSPKAHPMAERALLDGTFRKTRRKKADWQANCD